MTSFQTLAAAFTLLLTSDSCTQSKHAIIKEINNFKINALENVVYNCSDDTLHEVINGFFAANGFAPIKISDSLLVFEKIGYLECYRRISPSKNKYGQGVYCKSYGLAACNLVRYRKFREIFHIEVAVIERNGLKSIVINTNENKILRNIRSRNPDYNCPNYPFDPLDLRKHLYIRFCGDSIDFPQEIVNKINAYNASQVKERKILRMNVDY